jgi:hypothetical protein
VAVHEDDEQEVTLLHKGVELWLKREGINGETSLTKHQVTVNV